MNIDKSIKNRKADLLNYFRNRAEEFLSEIRLNYGNNQYKEQASCINKSLAKTRENLIETLLQTAHTEDWSNFEKLEAILIITYTNYIVMLEARNDVWPYDYMAFSRRIGEMWEPFCKLCFSYPINNLMLFVPPLFSEVKKKLSSEIEFYIEALNISGQEKEQLRTYYHKVWSLVTSGEIKLELDLHFLSRGQKYIVDFKSGFGSNEKGNTNRLLLVASIYQNLEENYNCMIFVRANENNNYYNTLKSSGVWNAYSGMESYDKMREYSGFDIRRWIDDNISWENDFKPEAVDYFVKNNLTQYLIW